MVGAEVGRLLVGTLAKVALLENIRHARAVMTSVVEAGYFQRERSVVFDFVQHFAAVSRGEALNQRSPPGDHRARKRAARSTNTA